MFCKECGTQALSSEALMCIKCGARLVGCKAQASFERRAPAPFEQKSSQLFCHKCGFHATSDEAEICVNCGVNLRGRTAKAEPRIIHWLSLILVFVCFITFGILGGDYHLQEVNFWDYLSIPISIGALVAAIVTIPTDTTGRMVLKIISIILSAYFILSTIYWVASYM